MADAGLFIGWGQVVRGREQRAIEVFNESVEYWAGLQSDDKIEDFEVVLFAPHGGDLQGYAILRGNAEQLNALRDDDEFQRRNTPRGSDRRGLRGRSTPRSARGSAGR